MAIFVVTLFVFMLFFVGLSVGLIVKNKTITTCATAKRKGDYGEIACGSCSVIDKDNCNKYPYNEATGNS
ncbi:MAG: hypothetical protein ABUK01_16890 [Leptospirales bacterium]